MIDNETSEFGKGFAYCIGLFLAHADRKLAETNTKIDVELWFNGAADHLYDLQVPSNFPLKNEVEDWAGQCIEWRLTNCTLKDKDWAIKQAKRFLLEYDRINGVDVMEATYV